MNFPAMILLFAVTSLVFLVISWKPLHNPRCHGFYRFFAFEGILALVLLNFPFWFDNLFDPRQIFSWICLFSSIFFVVRGVYDLRTAGGSARREASPENFAFENTAHLVNTGLFRYIRHPMYSSLLLLAWGTFLKHITPLTVVVIFFTSLMLTIAARIEERENLAFFGVPYRDYMRRTHKFIPFLY